MRIIIVGAGPCGLNTCRLLQEMGYDVKIFEEHTEIGRPVNCAGLVGRKFIKKYGDEHVVNQIDGAHIHLGDSQFSLHREGVAHVLDRCAFDRSLSEGVDVELGRRVDDIRKTHDGYKVISSGESQYCDILIGADGPNSLVRRSLPFGSAIRLFPAYQETIECNYEEDQMASIDVKRPFFSWIIPEGNRRVRVGTIGNRRGMATMKSKFGIDGKVVHTVKALIPIWRPSLVKDMSFLVGDAAAQTKPLTGGGLFYGLRASRMLSEAIDSGLPSLYQSLWDEKYGKEIKMGLKVRNIYENMSYNDLKKTFDIISERASDIEEMADFEKHSIAIRLILRSPKLLGVVGRSLLSLF